MAWRFAHVIYHASSTACGYPRDRGVSARKPSVLKRSSVWCRHSINPRVVPGSGLHVESPRSRCQPEEVLMRKSSHRGLLTEVRRISRSLRSLDASLKRLPRILSAATRDGFGGKGQGTGRSRRLSPRARAALVLQGRYMGYMRQLKPRQKAQVRRVRELKGVRSAIAAARRAASTEHGTR